MVVFYKLCTSAFYKLNLNCIYKCHSVLISDRICLTVILTVKIHISQIVAFRLPQTIGKSAQIYLFALAFLSIVLVFSQVLNRILLSRLAQQNLFQTNSKPLRSQLQLITAETTAELCYLVSKFEILTILLDTV